MYKRFPQWRQAHEAEQRLLRFSPEKRRPAPPPPGEDGEPIPEPEVHTPDGGLDRLGRHVGRGAVDAGSDSPDVPYQYTVDTNREVTGLHPKFGNEAPNETQMSFEKIVQMLKGTFEAYYQSVVSRTRGRFRRLKEGQARRAARGERFTPVVDLDHAEATLEAQMRGDFDRAVREVVKQTFRLKSMQYGTLKMTDLMKKAWPGFWDIVQDHPAFHVNHPLFRSQQWRSNFRIPGAYIKGELLIMSLPGMHRHRRQRSGVFDELKFEPSRKYHIEPNVPRRYQPQVSSLVASEFGIDRSTNDGQLAMGRLHWQKVIQGNEEFGFARFVEVTQAPLYDRGKPIEGTGRKGLVMIEGDRDHPENAPMAFIDYDYVDELVALGIENPHFKTLYSRTGYFSKKAIDAITQVLERGKNTAAEQRNWKFYADDAVALMIGHAPRLYIAIKSLQEAGITTQNDIAKLSDLTDEATKQKLKHAIEHVEDREALMQVLLTYCTKYIAEHKAQWWDNLLEELGVAVAVVPEPPPTPEPDDEEDDEDDVSRDPTPEPDDSRDDAPPPNFDPPPPDREPDTPTYPDGVREEVGEKIAASAYNEITALNAAEARYLLQKLADGTKILKLSKVQALSADSAAVLATFQGENIRLDGLSTISLDAITKLTEGDHSYTVYLNGLREVSAEVAAVVINEPETRNTRFGNITSMDADLAAQLIRINDKLNFFKLPELTPEAAEKIALSPGSSLSFYALRSLSKESAAKLSAFAGSHLQIGGFEQMTPGAAEGLAPFKGYLELLVTKLGEDSAEKLSTFAGTTIGLDNLTSLSEGEAQHIGALKCKYVSITGLRKLESTQVAVNLAKCTTEELDLAGVTELTGEQVEAFKSFAGEMVYFSDSLPDDVKTSLTDALGDKVDFFEM